MEYTIEITQYCENGCNYCSSNATPGGEHLPIGVIIDFLEKNSIEANDRINISGGEPLAHPDFYNILKACQRKTSNIWVYTNAIRQIKYNALVITEGVQVEANICLSPDFLNTQISIKDGTKINLLKLVPKGRGSNIKEIEIHVSGNIRGDCSGCQHVLLQADGNIAQSPCKKNYQ